MCFDNALDLPLASYLEAAIWCGERKIIATAANLYVGHEQAGDILRRHVWSAGQETCNVDGVWCLRCSCHQHSDGPAGFAAGAASSKAGRRGGCGADCILSDAKDAAGGVLHRLDARPDAEPATAENRRWACGGVRATSDETGHGTSVRRDNESIIEVEDLAVQSENGSPGEAL